MQEEIERLQDEMRKKLPDKRFRHTVGVRYTAEALAMRYDVDIDQAGKAGILHDCAKYMPGSRMYEECLRYGIEITEIEQKNPELLHAKLGKYYAEHVYEIRDAEILSAIRWHTTGRENMTSLEQIIFLADYIEPNRKMIPGLEKIRRMAFVDLEEAVYLTMKNTVSYLENQAEKTGEALFDPATQAAFQYYDARVKSR